MKKAVSVFMSLLIVFSAAAVSISATNGAKKNDEAYELPSEIITFDADCIEIGKAVTAAVDYSGDVTYEWYVDGVQIYNESNTFIPTKYDVEKIVTLKVYNSQKEYLGSRSICISNLPVVYVETVDRKEITDKTEQDAYIKFQGNSEFNDSSVLYEGDTVIKGRGNTTLLDAKKPFKLKLGSKANIFGMGKNKHWVLLSNPYDSSNIKNWVFNNVAAEMGLDYQKSEPVTLVLNGKYAGTYYVCEHIRIGTDRVDITNWDDEAENAAKAIYKANPDILTKDDRDVMIDNMTENMEWVTSDIVEYNGMTFTVSDYYDVPDVNGGYLMVIDKNQSYNTPNGTSLGIEKPEGIGSGMYQYITGYYQAFENALFSPDFCTEYNGEIMRYTDFIDVDSFAKGIIVNEFGCNADFGFRSTYMYKDTDGLLTYGPVWDFDLSSGKSNITSPADGFPTDYWRGIQKTLISRLCSDPYFLNRLRSLYWEYRYTAIADIFKEGGFIDSESQRIREAAYENEETWIYDESFDDAVKIFKRWASLRTDWLDTQFESITSIYNSMSKYFTTYYPQDEFLSTDDYVTKLEIVNYPSKINYNHGDEIDITGLELVAFFADGTRRTVDPTGIVSYAADYIGAKKTYTNVVSDEDSANIYVSLKYKNASVDYRINVTQKEDYKRVEELINKCPYQLGFNQRYLKEIFEAQAAYEALSDSAKANVSNYSRLEAAMNCVNAMAAATDSGIVGCYIADYNMNNSKKDMVYILKGDPNSVRWTLPNNRGTITFSPTKNMKSAKKVGGYSVWTLWANPQDFFGQALYYPAQNPGFYQYISNDYNATERDFRKIIYTSFVNLGTDAVINLESGPLTQKVIVKENGTAIAESDFNNNGIFTLNVPFDACGEHNLEIWFVSGGNEMYYKSVDILVRDGFPEPEPEIEPEPKPEGVVMNVVFENSPLNEKAYAVTVKGRAFKIQFIDDDGNTVTFSRVDIPNQIVSYNSDGEECSDIARNLSYEIWNVNLRIKPGHYVVIARTYETGWETREQGFEINVVNSTDYCDIYSISAASDSINAGEMLPITIVTGKDVVKLQIVVDDAQEGLVTFYASGSAVPDGDNLVYNVYVKLYTKGEHILRPRIKNANGWVAIDENTPFIQVTGT